MASKFLIEVCVDSVESALAAVRGGAGRLELCGNLGLGGGTTPSLGLFRMVKKKLPEIPIMVMIRPRTGDFLYTSNELEVMLEDIRAFKQAGATGVMFGVLEKEGRVDLNRTARLVNEARPLQVCFHRAFDMTRDAEEALHDVACIPGITRILTSGCSRSVLDGMLVLRGLAISTSELNYTLRILPGSGINQHTIGDLLALLLDVGVREVHLSGGSWVRSEMEHRPESMGMGVGGEGEWGIWRTSEDVVREVRTIIDAALVKTD